MDGELLGLNELLVTQQKTEEKMFRANDLDKMSMVTSNVMPQQTNTHNKLLEMEKQEDVLSVLDNQSVFIDQNAANRQLQKSNIQPKIQNSNYSANVMQPFGIQ